MITVIVRKFIAGVVVAAALPASAMMLGAGHGRLILGSPADLLFDVQADPGQSLEASCFAAAMDMGSTPVAERRVGLTLVPRSPGRFQLRVQTSVPVDEPVVFVRLDANCAGHFSRTYTFLTELSGMRDERTTGIVDVAPLQGEIAGTEMSATVSPNSGRHKPALEGGEKLTRIDTRTLRQPKARQKGKEQRLRPPQVKRAPASSLATQVQPRDIPKESPRLVMESLDMWVETSPELRLSMDVPNFDDSTASAARREDAVRAWQALNATPQEITSLGKQSDEARQQVQVLQAQLRDEKAAHLQLRQQLERALSQRFSGWVVYGLVGLLGLMLACLVWQMRRRRLQELEAWRQSVELSSGESVSNGIGETVWPPSENLEPPTANPEGKVTPVVDQEPAAPGAEDVAPSRTRTIASPVIPVVMPKTPHAQDIEHPEDLFDVLQQADFFISIGEHEQAVEGLRRHIAQHTTSSPLAYLELLRLYHTLGRIAAFDELRTGFEGRFNAVVPGFAAFQRGGKTLEDYGEELSRIQSLWGSKEIIEELDRLMFPRGASDELVRFDLPAYEDLLLLLAIAQTTLGKPRGSTTPASASGATYVPPGRVSNGGERRSVDTLAGDLALEPSAPIPVQGAWPAKNGVADTASLPEIVAPDVALERDPGEPQFSLQPRDTGRRGLKP